MKYTEDGREGTVEHTTWATHDGKYQEVAQVHFPEQVVDGEHFPEVRVRYPASEVLEVGLDEASTDGDQSVDVPPAQDDASEEVEPEASEEARTEPDTSSEVEPSVPVSEAGGVIGQFADGLNALGLYYTDEITEGTLDMLTGIDGVGPATARKIVNEANAG